MKQVLVLLIGFAIVGLISCSDDKYIPSPETLKQNAVAKDTTLQQPIAADTVTQQATVNQQPMAMNTTIQPAGAIDTVSQQPEKANQLQVEKPPEITSQYDWLQIPLTELSVQIEVRVGVCKTPTAVYENPMLVGWPTAKINRKGTREYKAVGNGCVILWSGVEDSDISGPIPMEFKWLVNQSVPETYVSTFIEKRFWGKKNDGGYIIFSRAIPLVSCSNIISFEHYGLSHKFVAIVHGYKSKESQFNSYALNGNTIQTYEGSRVTFWPYAKEFIEPLVKNKKEGDPFGVAASWLLSTFKEGKQSRSL
jgi:hypothetical protein